MYAAVVFMSGAGQASAVTVGPCGLLEEGRPGGGTARGQGTRQEGTWLGGVRAGEGRGQNGGVTGTEWGRGQSRGVWPERSGGVTGT